jgi:pilus assembly protein CpaF
MSERLFTSGLGTRRDGLESLEAELHQRLIHTIEDSQLLNLDRDAVRLSVERSARAILLQEHPQVVGDDKEDVISRVVDEVTGLGPIEPLLRDPMISEVMVNAPDEVFFEREGIIYEADVSFRNDAHVMRVIERIVAAIGRHVDEASPMVDARLPDGSRVNVIVPPLVPKSAVLTIRKFRSDRYEMQDLIGTGTLTHGMAEFLEGCIRAKLSMVVSGGTGTGKTTFLNAMSGYIPNRERIVTIEDPLELRLQQKHVIAMEGSTTGFNRGARPSGPARSGKKRPAHAPRPDPGRRGAWR